MQKLLQSRRIRGRLNATRFSKAIPHLNPDSQLDAIEHLAAKYLEVDGTGRLNSRSAFIRIAEEEPDVANALGLDRIE